MSYALKYFIHYPYLWINGDDQGQTTNADYYELQLHVKDFIGTPQQVPAGAGHPILRQDNSEQVVSQTLEFTVETSTGREFEDLYAEDPYSVEVILVHHNANTATESKLFRGWLITEQYNAPYIDPPFDITFSATDGIGLLKNKNFAMPLSTVRASEIAIIDHCLNNDLPQLTERYIVGLGIGHQGATAPASPLVTTYLNVSQFYDSDGLPMTRYDVLNAILRSYGPECYIKRNVDNYTIADTSFLMNTTLKPVHVRFYSGQWVVSASANNFLASQKVDIASNSMGAAAPAIVIDQLSSDTQKRNGLFELKQEYNVAGNMFRPGDILAGDFGEEIQGVGQLPLLWSPWGAANSIKMGIPANGRSKPSIFMQYSSGVEQYNRLFGYSDAVAVKASPTNSLIIEVGFHGQPNTSQYKARFSLRCGNYWLTNDGWQYNNLNAFIELPFTSEQSGDINVVTILANGFPVDGNVVASFGGVASPVYLDYVNITIDPAKYDPPASIIYNYSLSKYATGKLSAEIIGDAPANIPNIELLYKNVKLKSNGLPVWDWQLIADGVASTTRRLAELWLLTAASNSRIPRKLLSGIVHLQHRHIVRDYVAGTDNFNWLIIKPNAFPGNHPHFLFMSGEIDLITNEVSGSYLQCLPYQELEMYATSAVPGGGASGSDGSQSGGSGTVAGSVNSHTHANKALLDTYTQTEANIAKAVALAGALSIKQDAQGRNYIEAIHDFVSRKGVAAYASAEAEVPSIWDAMPIASPTKLGGIKVGTNLTIDGNGVLHAQAGGVSSWLDLSNKPVWLNYTTQAAFEGGHGHTWDQISGKPATFAPSAHSHTQADIDSAAGWIATALAGKASTAVATTTVNGLMAYADKLKLDGIAANANNYIHPTNHPASIITQDTNNRFVTDALIAAWNGKANAAHNHAQADIDSAAGWISTALASKQAAGSYLTTTGQAYDSARLGGVAAGSYARKDLDETFLKNLYVKRTDSASAWIVAQFYNHTGIARLFSNNQGGGVEFFKSDGVCKILLRGYGDSYFLDNVGIGTTAPTEILDVAGNIKSSNAVIAQNTHAATSRLFANTGGAGFYIHDGTGQKIRFGNYGDNFISYKLSINKTTAPSEALDVSGNIRAIGALKSTSCELLNASGVMQYRFTLSGTDCLIANAAGTTIGKIDQSGNLMMKGNITAFATL